MPLTMMTIKVPQAMRIIISGRHIKENRYYAHKVFKSLNLPLQGQ